MDDGRKEKTSFCIVDAQSVKNHATGQKFKACINPRIQTLFISKFTM